MVVVTAQGQPLSAQAAPADGSTPAAHRDDFLPDFSEGTSRGIGFRLVHAQTGRYLDLRLRGFAGHPATVSGRTARFAAGNGVDVSYSRTPSGVKETIVLRRRDLSRFVYDLRAPDLQVSEHSGQIAAGAPYAPALFVIDSLKVQDGAGRSMASTLSYDADSEQMVVGLNPAEVASAALPIIVDPLISGVSPAGMQGSHARQVFQASDRLIFFSVDAAGSTETLVYRTSTDEGATWSSPVTVNGATNHWGFSVGHNGDTFGVAYVTGALGTELHFRLLTRSGSTWQVGAERTVPVGAGSGVSSVTVASRGTGAQGERFAVGYVTSVTDWESRVAMTEDGGATWSGSTVCSPNAFPGSVVAASGSRLLCISSDANAGVSSREWNGSAWAAAVTVPVPTDGYVDSLPSVATASDGSIHLVDRRAGASPGAYHSSLSAGSSTWTTAHLLGPLRPPVISTAGQALYVYGPERLSEIESPIAYRFSLDLGATWRESPDIGGRELTYVIDHATAWSFENDVSDALFRIGDGSANIGNGIGTSSDAHRLDSATKRLSFGFTMPAAGTVGGVSLWSRRSVLPAPLYRIGVQTDLVGNPSGTWVDQGIGTGAYSDVSFAAAPSSVEIAVDLPNTSTIAAGTRLHVVAEPAPGQTPTASSWIEVDAASAATDAMGGLDVLDSSAPGAWTQAPGQVPRFVVSSGTGVDVVAQKISRAGTLPATYHSYPFEVFSPVSAITPTTVRVFLAKEGGPSGDVTLRLLDATGTEIWSGNLTPVEGWNTVAISGVALAAGATYRLGVQQLNPRTADLWSLALSGDAPASWGGTAAKAQRAFDVPGYNDRDLEARDDRLSPTDLVPFSSTGDHLYLGDYEPFSDLALAREDAGGSVTIGLEYWTGSAWSTLSTTANTLGDPGGGTARFDPPADWKETDVDGRGAYWVRASAPPQGNSFRVLRLTTYRDLTQPVVVPEGANSIALAWTTGGTVELVAQNPIPDQQVTNKQTWDIPKQSTFQLMPSGGPPNDQMRIAFELASAESTKVFYVRINAYAVKPDGTRGTPTDRVILQGTKIACANRSADPPPDLPIEGDHGNLFAYHQGTENNLGPVIGTATYYLYRFDPIIQTPGTFGCYLYGLGWDDNTAFPDNWGLRVDPDGAVITMFGEPQTGAKQWGLVERLSIPPGDSHDALDTASARTSWTVPDWAQSFGVRAGVEFTNCSSPASCASGTPSDQNSAKVSATLTVTQRKADGTSCGRAFTRNLSGGNPQTISWRTHHWKGWLLVVPPVAIFSGGTSCTRKFDFKIVVTVASDSANAATVHGDASNYSSLIALPYIGPGS